VIAATWRATISSARPNRRGQARPAGRLQRQRPSRQGGRRPRRYLRNHENRRQTYPSCRYTHAALDALIAMPPGAQSDARPDQARRDRPAPQRHHAHRRCRHQAASDLYRRRTVLDVLHGCRGARSGPLRLGRLRKAGDAKVDALADKFDVVQDDRLEIGRSHPFGARVSITPTTACMSGSTLIPPANRDRFRTRRRWRRNS